MVRPPFIELKLTSPRQENDTIAYVQDMINRRSPKYVRGLDVDGIMGIHTGEELRAFKYRMGWAIQDVVPAIGPDGLNLIWQWDQEGTPFPEPYRYRRMSRMSVPFSLRKGISPLTWRLLHPGSYPQPTNLQAGLDVALGWARQGLREDPSGSNYVPALSRLAFDLGVRSNFANMRYAWCAYAFYLAHLKAGHPVAKAGLVDGQFWPLFTPTLRSYADRGVFGHKAVSLADAKPGMGVLFSFDSDPGEEHIGMYIDRSSSMIETVDGNSSASGSQSNGGMCIVRQRSLSQVTRIYTIG